MKIAFRVLSIFVFVLLSYLLLIEMQPSTPLVPWLDKIQHIIAFGGLSGVAMLGFPKQRLKLALLIAIYGGVMEFLQGWLTQTRQPGLVDWLADLVGIVLAMVVVTYLLRWWATRHARV